MQQRLQHPERKGHALKWARYMAAVLCLSALVLASGCQSPSALLAQRAHYIVGYTDSRCDDPRGQYYNGLTRRAMVVRADGSGRREIGQSLITRECQATTITGWWPDGRAILNVGYKSPEVGAWENRT